MRILYLNTTYSGGGAEKVTRQIYDGMKKRGHDVYEIVCYNRHGTVEDEHVHVLYNGTVGKVLMRLQTANRANEDLTISYAINYIEQFVKKHKIELIHLNNPHDSFLGIRDIGKLTEWCPVVWTLHDFGHLPVIVHSHLAVMTAGRRAVLHVNIWKTIRDFAEMCVKNCLNINSSIYAEKGFILQFRLSG